MRQALWLLGAAAAALAAALAGLGPATTAAAGFGGVAAMAALISGTFLWLWWVRATPLALGMALSWAGSALIAGWLAATPAAAGLPLAALPLLTAGATLHFAVMRTSMGLGRAAGWAPAAAVCAAAMLAFLFTKA
jgi:hypothetical protein